VYLAVVLVFSAISEVTKNVLKVKVEGPFVGRTILATLDFILGALMYIMFLSPE
jgi:hypothetical protein